ncbi:phosphoribosylformylglycinamidine synthase subunit PurL [Candidatus Saganbacteria bacterium]|nr:phosphoribosylformylglycinamidine synthase subunit PurL [Candidatus Saganbacteria bacterium]
MGQTIIIASQVYKELGLSDKEYQRIWNILGRDPSPTELAMFSVEWSEHCGYPRSRKYLKLFPQKGKYESLVGEDAGGIIYDDTAIIFKMESHNHPSQVEPKQGAATGVGGIIRDIFTAGARPIACLDSLRFGDPTNPKNKFIFDGVVDGIQFYGNCVGVPTVGGEIYFNDAYAGNCLVNVMCVGVCDRSKIARAKAVGIGNSIIYAGSRTGRDGIGGCSVLASAEFSEKDCEKRPTVQVGDPFTEKCLIEATLEALENDAVFGIKDMGAAGLTCSSSEMAAAGGVGVAVDLDLVPLREEGMEPYEIMMSESQERMLLCVKAGHEDEIIKVFVKWGLEAATIGKVIPEKLIKITRNKELIAEIPIEELANAPLYDMPWEEPPTSNIKPPKINAPKDLNKTLLQLMGSPNIASKKAVYEQYDHMVQVNTSIYPGGDATVLRMKDKPWGIAVTSDCNGLYCKLDPFIGAQIAVAEACRNIVVTGADPAAVTDCLNFGNPEKPDRYYYFKRCVEGIINICKEFELPVISGNVSFYNESPQGPILPTPTIGMVGILKDIEKRCTVPFKDNGDLIILLGINKDELGGSEYLQYIHKTEEGQCPSLDLDLEKKVQAACSTAIEVGIVKSAHDLSEGGLASAISECSILGNKGAAIYLKDDLRPDSLLFSETQSRILLTIDHDNIFAVSDICMLLNVPFEIIGKVAGKNLSIKHNDKKIIDLPVSKLAEAYYNAIL